MNIKDAALREYDDHVEVDINNQTYKFETFFSFFNEFGVKLLTIDGKLIGSLLAELDTGGVGSVLIEEKYRNQGFGELLLSYVIQEYNARKLWVDKKNAPAVHLYLKLGFHWTGDVEKVKTVTYELMER